MCVLFPKLYRFDRLLAESTVCQQRLAINLTFKSYLWTYLRLFQAIDHPKRKLAISLFLKPHAVPKPCFGVSIEHTKKRIFSQLFSIQLSFHFIFYKKQNGFIN